MTIVAQGLYVTIEAGGEDARLLPDGLRSVLLEPTCPAMDSKRETRIVAGLACLVVRLENLVALEVAPPADLPVGLERDPCVLVGSR